MIELTKQGKAVVAEIHMRVEAEMMNMSAAVDLMVNHRWTGYTWLVADLRVVVDLGIAARMKVGSSWEEGKVEMKNHLSGP